MTRPATADGGRRPGRQRHPAAGAGRHVRRAAGQHRPELPAHRRLAADGDRVVLTHGNGPQVGNILIQNDLAAKLVPPMPMDVCGAETPGTDRLPAAAEPAQPPPAPACRCRRGHAAHRSGRRTRPTRLSPRPRSRSGPSTPKRAPASSRSSRGGRCARTPGAAGAASCPRPNRARSCSCGDRRPPRRGALVICGGGGGIPVIRHRDGSLHGIEAVIDKDLAAARLAADLGADVLLILTDVANVYVDYGGRRADRPRRASPLAELAALPERGPVQGRQHGAQGRRRDALRASGGRSVVASLTEVTRRSRQGRYPDRGGGSASSPATLA